MGQGFVWVAQNKGKEKYFTPGCPVTQMSAPTSGNNLAIRATWHYAAFHEHLKI